MLMGVWTRRPWTVRCRTTGHESTGALHKAENRRFEPVAPPAPEGGVHSGSRRMMVDHPNGPTREVRVVGSVSIFRGRSGPDSGMGSKAS